MHLCTCLFLHALVWAHGHIASEHDILRRCLQEECIETSSPVFTQLTQTQNSRSPNPGVDFLESGINRLDEMDPSTVPLVEAYPGFDCKEGVSQWKLGWSPEKKDFCCRAAKVGCAENTETNTNKTSNVTELSTCITREDPRASSIFHTTSPVGTPCIFGVDPRDEGSHCIMEGGKYGSFGWCCTSNSKQSWGSCAESCPLLGSSILGAKISKLDLELGDTVRAKVKKVLADTRQENTTTVPRHGQTTAAPAASGKKSGNATGNASAKAGGKARNKNSDNAKVATNGTSSPNKKKHAKQHDGHDTHTN